MTSDSPPLVPLSRFHILLHIILFILHFNFYYHYFFIRNHLLPLGACSLLMSIYAFNAS